MTQVIKMQFILTQTIVVHIRPKRFT